MKKSLLKVLIVVIIVTLILGGAVYAYQVLWSGKAEITIEPPIGATGSGQLEIIGVEAGSNGMWDDATNTWISSIARGERASLSINFKNVGGDAIHLNPYINGHELSADIAAGVSISTTGGYLVAAGATDSIGFHILVSTQAQSGTLPQIQLEIRQE